MVIRLGIEVGGDADLLEIAAANGFLGGLPGFSKGRQKDRQKNGNDSDDDKQFNQRKGISTAEHPGLPIILMDGVTNSLNLRYSTEYKRLKAEDQQELFKNEQSILIFTVLSFLFLIRIDCLVSTKHPCAMEFLAVQMSSISSSGLFSFCGSALFTPGLIAVAVLIF